MRRNGTEMIIMRKYIKYYLNRTNGDYKKSYDLYKEYVLKVGKETAEEITCIRGIKDFREESKKYTTSKDIIITFSKDDLDNILKLRKESKNEDKKRELVALWMAIKEDDYNQKNHCLSMLQEIKRDLENIKKSLELKNDEINKNKKTINTGVNTTQEATKYLENNVSAFNSFIVNNFEEFKKDKEYFWEQLKYYCKSFGYGLINLSKKDRYNIITSSYSKVLIKNVFGGSLMSLIPDADTWIKWIESAFT